MGSVFDHSGPERLVAGGLWFLILMILSGVSWLLSSIVVSWVYGPIGLGIFNTSQSLHNFVWVFVFGGMFQGLMKYGSEYLTRKDRKTAVYFSNALKYMTAIGIVAFLLLYGLSFYIQDQIAKIMVLTLAVSFLFSGTKDALASIIGSFQKSNYLSIVNSTKVLPILAGGIIFILMGVPVHMLPLLLIGGTVWQLILCIYFYRTRLRGQIPFKTSGIFNGDEQAEPQSFIQFSKIATFGLFISLGMIAFNVMKSLDIIVLNLFFDYARVGVYSVADAASSILFYMTSFSLPIIPAIAEAHEKKNKDLLKDYVKISVKYPLLIGVPLTIIILMMAEPIVVGIYGPAFADAVVPLQILIVGTFMLMLGYTLSSILIGVGKSRLSGMLMAIAAVQYIVSLFILTPIFGFVGAALSLTLTGLTSMLLVPYFLKKEIGISIYDGIPKVLLSAFIMAVTLSIVPKTNIVVMILGTLGSAALFVSSLYKLEFITEEDIRMMRNTVTTFRRPHRRRKTAQAEK